MATWPEAMAAKDARQRRQRRHYTADQLGRPCSEGCGIAMPRALLKLGITAHPTCGPQARHEMGAAS